MSIIINDILVPMLSYSCLNNEKLQEGARLRIEIETQISKNKNKENLKLVEVDFSIMIQELSDNKEEFLMMKMMRIFVENLIQSTGFLLRLQKRMMSKFEKKC